MAHGRLLIIDDDPDIGRLLRRIFGSEYEVALTEKPEDALALLQSGRRFDCILCDVCMPKLNGVETLRMIGEIDPAQADRLIFVTAYPPAAATVERSTRRTIVQKPFQTLRLRELVEARMAAPIDEWDEPTVVS